MLFMQKNVNNKLTKEISYKTDVNNKLIWPCLHFESSWFHTYKLLTLVPPRAIYL